MAQLARISLVPCPYLINPNRAQRPFLFPPPLFDPCSIPPPSLHRNIFPWTVTLWTQCNPNAATPRSARQFLQWLSLLLPALLFLHPPPQHPQLNPPRRVASVALSPGIMMVSMSSLIRPSRFGLLVVAVMAIYLTVLYREHLPPVPPMLPSGKDWSLDSVHSYLGSGSAEAAAEARAAAMWTCDRCTVNTELCEKFGT